MFNIFFKNKYLDLNKRLDTLEKKIDDLYSLNLKDTKDIKIDENPYLSLVNNNKKSKIKKHILKLITEDSNKYKNENSKFGWSASKLSKDMNLHEATVYKYLKILKEDNFI